MPLYQPIVVTSLVTITGGGTLALAGFTLTVPATGTLALIGITNQFSARQDIGGSGAGWSSGLYVLGDSSTTAAAFRGGARSGIETYSDSSNGAYAQSTSGAGVRAISSSSSAVYATTSNSGSSAQALLLEITGSSTTDTANGFDLHHTTSDTPAAGFGVQARFFLKSSTTTFRTAAYITALWNDPADASRKADLVFKASDSANDREFLRGRGTGAAAAVGFLGATPVIRQTVSAAASDPATTQTLVNDIRTALINLGLAV